MIKWVEQDHITTMMYDEEAKMVIMRIKQKYDVFESSSLSKIGVYDKLEDAKMSCLGFFKFNSNKGKSIAVIGVGTAGVTALSHLLAWTPDDATIVSVYDPELQFLESVKPPLCIFQKIYSLALALIYYKMHMSWMPLKNLECDTLDLERKTLIV